MQSVPIPGSIIEDRSLSSCTGFGNCRTIWNIILSCLVTIFACTWVAVHPNLPITTPGKKTPDRWYNGSLRRTRIMLYALMGPEFIILWAFRQWCAASIKPKKPTTLPDWSSTHGFFASMGGFVSHDGEKMLTLGDIERMVGRKEIEYPIVSEAEIKDRSKGDAVTKALVVLQITWFLLQCAARGHRGFAITELELVTAAYALLNIGTYVIWWDKPRDVQCPIRVRKLNVQDVPEANTASGGQTAATHGTNIIDERPFLRRTFRNALMPFNTMMSGDGDEDSMRIEDDMFFIVGPDELSFVIFLGAIFVTLIFGGIHCIGWANVFHFPSRPEQLIWRISSICITGIPLAVPFILLTVCLGFPGKIFYLLMLLYIFSRVALLVLAFTTLRSLPPSALQTVEWTTFLPHI